MGIPWAGTVAMIDLRLPSVTRAVTHQLNHASSPLPSPPCLLPAHPPPALSPALNPRELTDSLTPCRSVWSSWHGVGTVLQV